MPAREKGGTGGKRADRGGGDSGRGSGNKGGEGEILKDFPNGVSGKGRKRNKRKYNIRERCPAKSRAAVAAEAFATGGKHRTQKRRGVKVRFLDMNGGGSRK